MWNTGHPPAAARRAAWRPTKKFMHATCIHALGSRWRAWRGGARDDAVQPREELGVPSAGGESSLEAAGHHERQGVGAPGGDEEGEVGDAERDEGSGERVYLAHRESGLRAPSQKATKLATR